MENLGDILKRLRENQSTNGDGTDRDNEITPPGESQEYVCPICEGRLWLAIDAPVGHPDFGKAEPCQCQADLDLGERASRLRRYSNLGPLSRLTFGSADPEGLVNDPESKRLYRIAHEAAKAFAEQPLGWLVLTGPHGSGKTHLAAAISNHCIEEGRPVFFVHVPDLLDDLRATYSPMSELSYSDLFEQVNEAPLLVLDGLGAQSPTPWAQEKLQQIFNHRANSELPTIVTTAAQLSEIDPYISSRMKRPTLSRVVEIRGADHEPTSQLGRVPSGMIERMTFDSFDTRGNGASPEEHMSLQSALEAAQNWASAPDGWLTLVGQTGVGKTHLAVAIAATRLANGLPVFFAFVPRLMDYLRATFQPGSGTAFDHVVEEVRDAPMLILDDLGWEHRSDWAYEKLYQIVVHRHNLRLPTVFTTGVDIFNAAGPIASRIKDPAVDLLTRIEAPDYRVKDRSGSRQGISDRTPGRFGSPHERVAGRDAVSRRRRGYRDPR